MISRKNPQAPDVFGEEEWTGLPWPSELPGARGRDVPFGSTGREGLMHYSGMLHHSVGGWLDARMHR